MRKPAHRHLAAFAASLTLLGCTGTVDSVRQSAEAAFRSTLAFQFLRRLGTAVDLVVQSLSAEGGYLDNPLVRILLPPPVGLVIDVTRDLHANPKAALLETLMNRAAEHAVPGAGPILLGVLRDLERPEAQGLLAAGRTAATNYLQEKAGAAVHEALRPAVAERLRVDGAVDVYRELLEARDVAELIAESPEAIVEHVAPEDLEEYVTGKAVEGLFRALAQREAEIRAGLPQLAPPAGARPEDATAVLQLDSPEITVPASGESLRVTFGHWIANECGWDRASVHLPAFLTVSGSSSMIGESSSIQVSRCFS